MTILDLPTTIAGLPVQAQDRIERLFRIDVAVGTNDPPAPMHEWLALERPTSWQISFGHA